LSPSDYTKPEQPNAFEIAARYAEVSGNGIGFVW